MLYGSRKMLSCRLRESGWSWLRWSDCLGLDGLLGHVVLRPRQWHHVAGTGDLAREGAGQVRSQPVHKLEQESVELAGCGIRHGKGADEVGRYDIRPQSPVCRVRVDGCDQPVHLVSPVPSYLVLSNCVHPVPYLL